MFINSVELQNIRTYKSQKIVFNKGITLLSGDIGSGKTTILLAMEFALFGILRGKTSVNELLSHDEKEGSVILNCEIRGKEVKIKRSLKRTSSSISQKEGYISINGTKEIFTPTELKAKVLTLLGYPESLINKSTNLFRYTVYTPQEQVKLILRESPEERKDVIRKIFDIDKYKRVSENISFYSSDLRERISFLKGHTEGLKIIQEQFSAQKIELDKLNKQVPEAKLKLDSVSEELSILEKEKNRLDLEIIKYNKEESKYKLIEQSLESKKEYLKSINKQLDEKENFLKNSSLKEKEFDISKKDRLKSAFNTIKELRSKLDKQKGVLDDKKINSEKIIEDISSLKNCPTCKQDVSDDHKNHIKEEQEKNIKDYDLEEKKLMESYSKLSEKEKELEDKKIFVEKEEKEYLIYQERKKQIERSKEDIKKLSDNKLTKQEEIKQLEQNLDSQKQLISKGKPIIDQMLIKQFNEVSEQKKKTLENHITLKTRLEIANKDLELIKENLIKQAEFSKQITKLSSLKEWLSELFVPLLKTIEKRVLFRVYNDFNKYFINWFSILIDDDAFTVRLDDDFTPKIEQNGYDTTVENLSGGEKTSLALAYRLALNKVLNSYFGSLHTKDLLILDEPTDGFSTEQIDRLRDVFSELELSQLILVSHEQKLESLAENIIRVEKKNQISVIIE